VKLRTNQESCAHKHSHSIYKHLWTFTSTSKDKGHSHDVLLRTRRLSRKNIKEREEAITPRPVSQILTRSHKCRYFSILEPVQLEENKCLHSPLNKACCRYLNLTTQKTNAPGLTLPRIFSSNLFNVFYTQSLDACTR
jgi:hypothetical protein